MPVCGTTSLAIFRPGSLVTEKLCDPWSLHQALAAHPRYDTTQHDTTRHDTTRHKSFFYDLHDSGYILLLVHPSIHVIQSSHPEVLCFQKCSSPLTAWALPTSPTTLSPTSVAAQGHQGRGWKGRGLTACEISVDGLLGHTMQPLHVILTVPDPQLLPRVDVTAGTEVNPLAVLEGHQILLPLLPRDDHVPEGKVTRQA